MCGETRIPRDMCAGNTHPWETHITVTPVPRNSHSGLIRSASNNSVQFELAASKSVTSIGRWFESGSKDHVKDMSFVYPLGLVYRLATLHSLYYNVASLVISRDICDSV